MSEKNIWAGLAPLEVSVEEITQYGEENEKVPEKQTVQFIQVAPHLFSDTEKISWSLEGDLSDLHVADVEQEPKVATQHQAKHQAEAFFPQKCKTQPRKPPDTHQISRGNWCADPIPQQDDKKPTVMSPREAATEFPELQTPNQERCPSDDPDIGKNDLTLSPNAPRIVVSKPVKDIADYDSVLKSFTSNFLDTKPKEIDNYNVALNNYRKGHTTKATKLLKSRRQVAPQRERPTLTSSSDDHMIRKQNTLDEQDTKSRALRKHNSVDEQETTRAVPHGSHMRSCHRIRPMAAVKRKPMTNIPMQFRLLESEQNENSDYGTSEGAVDTNNCVKSSASGEINDVSYGYETCDPKEHTAYSPDTGDGSLSNEQGQCNAAPCVEREDHIEGAAGTSDEENEGGGLLEKHNRDNKLVDQPDNSNLQRVIEAKQLHEASMEIKEDILLHKKAQHDLYNKSEKARCTSNYCYPPHVMSSREKEKYLKEKISTLTSNKKAVEDRSNELQQQAFQVRKTRLSKLLSSFGIETNCVIPVISNVSPLDEHRSSNLNQQNINVVAPSPPESSCIDLSVYDERDKALSAECSDIRRDIQLYTEAIRRLNHGSPDSDLLGIKIPQEFITVKEKTAYLDFRIHQMKTNKKEAKKKRAAVQKERKLAEQNFKKMNGDGNTATHLESPQDEIAANSLENGEGRSLIHELLARLKARGKKA